MHDRAETSLPRPKSITRKAAVLGAVALTAGGTAAAPAQAHGGSKLDPTERRVIRLMNRNRAVFHLPRLRTSHALARSANAHSLDMLRRNFFAHNSSNGTPFDARIRHFKRAARIGENLAYVAKGQRGGQARTIVSMWLNSPGHRAVLLSPAFRRVGVARRTGRLGSARVTVFTADFTSRR